MNTSSPTLLSDLQILRRLVAEDEECLFISPLIEPNSQLGPSSLDVRIGWELRIPRTFATTHIDLSRSAHEIGKQIASYFDVQRVGADDGFVIHPGEFALASTLEFIRLPRDIAARLEGRSSLGRLGLQVHATAGFVDPGFEGTLTFELFNAGKLPIKLFPGLRLGQLCFFLINEVQVPYTKKPGGKYAYSMDPALSKIYRDIEVVGAPSPNDLSEKKE